jgi:hypothetical protein
MFYVIDVEIREMRLELVDNQKIRCFANVSSSLRKIDANLIMECRADSFSLRALNETQSALPIIQFKASFFEEYCYTSNQTFLAYKLTGQWLIQALRSVIRPRSVKLSLNSNERELVVNVTDHYGIKHIWSLFLEETSVLKAAFDDDAVSATVQFRYDIFNSIPVAFKGHENIIIKIAQNDPLIFTVTENEEGLDSMFSLQKTNLWQATFQDHQADVQISVSLADFAVGIGICSIISQNILLSAIGSGYPIIIRAQLPNSVSFQMAMATSTTAPAPSPDLDPVSPQAMTRPNAISGTTADRIMHPSTEELFPFKEHLKHQIGPTSS